METIKYDLFFKKKVKKIRDKLLKEKVKKQIEKIVRRPDVGKPMRFSRKGTREVHVKPFRLSYYYLENKDEITFLDLYHKDEQ